jgi:hypothetical protein
MEKSRLNSIASSLLWLWGILVLLIGVSLGYPAFATHGATLPLIMFGIWGVVVCVAAFAMRKRRWGVRWWSTALCVISAVLIMLPLNKFSLFGAAINVGALVLVLLSWNLPASGNAQPSTQT